MADKKKKAAADLAEQLREVNIEDFELSKLERMFYYIFMDPENKGLKELADYTEQKEIEQELINNSYYKAGNLSFLLSLASVAIDWEPEEQAVLIDLLETYKDTGKLSKESLEKLAQNKDHLNETIEAIKTPKTLRPEDYIQTPTKAALTIFDGKETLDQKIEGLRGLITKEGKTPEKYIYVNLSSEKNISGLDNLTEFDKSVHSAVISYFNETGERIFTARQIAQFLFYGTDNYTRTSPERVEEINASLYKMMHLQVTIDFKEHAELKKKKIKNFEISRYILPLDKIKMDINGEEQEAFCLIVMPPLLQYAKAVDMINRIPAKLLDCSAVRSTPENIIIRDFLFEEIGHMKKLSYWNRTLTIDHIMESSGIDLDKYKSKQSKSNKRKKVIEVVRNYCENMKKENYINDYTLNTGGKRRNDSVYSITITP